jgi:AcrR family transcriptional regulator
MLETNIVWVTTTVTSTKSARTRARLMVAGFELFARQGYEQTTVGQIATAAGVTEMTFYRHFGSKDQLLIDDPYDPLIAKAIGEQPTELPPLARTVRGVRLAWRRLPIGDDDPVRERVAIVAATPSLLPALRASTSATETAIADQLVADGSDATEAAIAAAATMAALMTGLMRWAVADGGTLGAAIERSLDVVEPCHD